MPKMWRVIESVYATSAPKYFFVWKLRRVAEYPMSRRRAFPLVLRVERQSFARHRRQQSSRPNELKEVFVTYQQVLFTTIAAGSLLAVASLAVAVSAGGAPSNHLPLHATYRTLPQNATT